MTDDIPGFEDIQNDGEEERKLYACETLDEFVVKVLLPLYPQVWRPEIRWCADWRKHEPAVGRLNAVWHNWESVREDPGAISNWMINHADYHMAFLMAENGPFDGCSIGTIDEPKFIHKPRVRRLPSAAAPEGLFPKYPTA